MWPKVILFLAITAAPVMPQNFCRTPGYKFGRCVSIYDCDYLLKILMSNQLTQQSIRFLQLSQCDPGIASRGAPHVCCARNDDSLILHPTTESVPASALSSKTAATAATYDDDENTDDSIVSHSTNGTGLLPDRSECGQELIENRIYSGQNADREEFPWLALLEYRRFSGEVSINCAGSLISRKYVMTACHCIAGDIISRIGELVNVRLGEYDLRQSDACIGRRCGNPHHFNEIDEVIPHESFNHRSNNRRHDIGLIRLKRAVAFSRLLRPICLPTRSEPPLKVGDTVYIAGFGRTLFARTSQIKQKLALPIFDFDECKRKFATKKVRIHKDQICAGGEFSRDACDGDSGGALSRFHNNWVAEGIVSFGYLCGLQGWPAIYTKVVSHLDWIERHVKP